MRDDSFQRRRINLLVSLCGALEHAVKAYFVDGCRRRAGQQMEWQSICLDAADPRNAERSSIEVWFDIASRRWQTDTQPVGRRLTSFVQRNCAVSSGKVFDASRFEDSLNQTFALRNALIRNWGMPTAHLVKRGFAAGQRIFLSAEATWECVKVLQGAVNELRPASDRITLADV